VLEVVLLIAVTWQNYSHILHIEALINI